MKTFTEAEIEELKAKAGGMYTTLVSLTDSPREAATVIQMMHLLLFLNCGDGKTTVNAMLDDYTKNFKANWDLHMAHTGEGMN